MHAKGSHAPTIAISGLLFYTLLVDPSTVATLGAFTEKGGSKDGPEAFVAGSKSQRRLHK